MTESRLPETLAVVVPCYNVGDRVPPVIEGLLQHVSTVIAVDDGSTDGCIEPLRKMPIEIVTFPRNRGKGFALQAGFETVLGDPSIACVAVVDSDGQHDPDELPSLYEAFVREDADLVIGSRQFGGSHVPWRSRFGNTMTITIAGWLLGTRVPDTQSGYRLHSRRFLEAELPNMSGGLYEFEMGLLARGLRGGYHVVSSPIQTIYEEGNRVSHFNKGRDSYRIYRTLLKTAWQTRRVKPAGD